MKSQRKLWILVAGATMWLGACGGDGRPMTSLANGGSAGETSPGGSAGAPDGVAGSSAATGGRGGGAGADGGAAAGAGTAGSAAGGSAGSSGAPLAIDGSYTDDFGYSHVLTSSAWTQEGPTVFEILDYDNGEGWLVAHNAATNEWNPDAYSRFDWTLVAGELWYCQTAYAAATLAEALATPAADATDPETSGCGGFSWSHLTPE